MSKTQKNDFGVSSERTLGEKHTKKDKYDVKNHNLDFLQYEQMFGEATKK